MMMMMMMIIIIIHCLIPSPQPLQNRVLHTVWSSASSFNFRYPLVSLRSFSSCFRLLPQLPILYLPLGNVFYKIVTTQVVTNPVSLLRFILRRAFLSSLTLCNPPLFFTWSFQLIFPFFINATFQNFECFWSAFRSFQFWAPHKAMLQMWHFTSFLLKFKSRVYENTHTHTHTQIWAFRNKLKREKLTGEGRNHTARNNAFCDIRVVDSGMTRVCGNAARIRWECMKHLSWESWRERTVWET